MISLVRSAKSAINNSYLQSVSLSLVNVTEGDFLIALISGGGAVDNIASVTDNKGNVWTKLTSRHYSTSDSIFYANNVAAGTTTITATTGGSYDLLSMTVREYSGVADANPIKKWVVTDTPGYVNNPSVSITPDFATDALIGFYAFNNGSVVGQSTPNVSGIVSAPNGDYTNGVSFDYAYNVTSPVSVTINLSDYVQGSMYAIELLSAESTTPPPLDPVPGETNIPGWYKFGAPPAKSLEDLSDAFATVYAAWKAYTVTQGGMPSGMPATAYRIKVPDQNDPVTGQPNGTFSEGIGYGMILTSIVSNPAHPNYDPAAKNILDGLIDYYKFYLNSRGLMNWRISHTGTVTGENGATDGDEDIALGLLYAHYIHGDGGRHNYGTLATTLINNILAYEFYPANSPGKANILTNGDGWDSTFSGSPDWSMPDYFAPAWYRMFYEFTGNSRWLDIIDVNYEILRRPYFNLGTGFVPDNATRSAQPVSGQSFINGYNAIRGPWRTVADYLMYGDDTNELAYYFTKQMADFTKGVSGGNPANNFAEYTIDGATHANYINAAYNQQYLASTLVSDEYETYGASIVDWLVANNPNAYFGMSLVAITMLLASGQMRYDYTSSGVDVWNGTAWVRKPVKRWNGTAWVDADLKTWNGTTWA